MQNVAHNIQNWIASPTAEQPLLVISSSEKIILECIETAKLALAQTGHPDIFTITGEKDRIYMKDIEALKPLLAYRAGKRLVLIPHADQILPEAASGLLKILEEPSASTRFLLGAKSKRGILPTIRSRCRILFAGSDIVEEHAINSEEFLTRLSGLRKPEPFSDQDLQDIAGLVHHLAGAGTVSPALFRVSQRLRDYYKIAIVPGGNTKLAADILLASLAELRNTVSYVNHTS